MSNDIAVGAVTVVNQSLKTNKPSYLVVYEDVPNGKTKQTKRFVTIDKPDTNSSFIQMKGMHTELSDEELNSSYQEVLTNAPREVILELMVPWHRVFLVRSLVFKAK